ncbi:uncharacterized protein LOC131536081 isoform X2 [Onychostoma macrolepis]|uniref:uncharacterized protein LOC131536081 isoform X2 n=1 Tax=Onychostoma macrolepis TaxID=369639 RepID=UPI00272A9012|nr:uncharacterized protein LOC131536081 isoform X2 [Onychostoma macrolepis]
MACAQQSAKEYLRNTRKKLVTGLKNLPLIVENLYQKKVFSVYEVDALKAESAEFDKARCILDWVINKGDEASYEFLQILDVTKKRTLDPGLHPWISCSPFRDDDAEPSYSFGTKPCQIYQTRLKMKARSILKNQRKCFCKYLEDEVQGNFSFIPLVLKTDSVIKTLCKIKLKSKKCKKLRPKKLRAYIPNEGQTLSPEGLLRWQDKNILIIGKPGVGKTTVVQEMLRLWAEKDGRQIDYMFYFDESVLAHNSVASLEALLFDVYSKPLDEDRKEVFQDLEENSENVVIVFDGVTDLKEGSVLWKIMDHDLLPDAKIVITCRSEEEDDPLLSDWPTRTVYVQGFSEESIKTYYQRMLGHDPVLLEVILKNQELFSLSHVPMYASMVTAFISFKNYTKNKHPHTVTEMYIHIFRLAVKKHGNKQNKQIDNYLKEKKDQILQLMENTFNATKQKCLNLSDINSDETDICHAFLKMITTTDSPTSAATYCAFLHNTMQEFFSALWLLGHPDEIEDVLQLCQTEEHKHMRHVLPFLCGLLSERNTRLIKCLFPEDQIKKTSDWFSEKLLDVFLQPQSESEEFDLLYVCQCLYELQSPKACLMFLEKMNHQLDLEVDLDPHQCCALSYVIGQSRDKEVYLNLEDCNVTDVGMNMMLSCSPNIRLKTCEDPLKQITFFVEFFHKSSRCDCKLIDMRERYDPEKCSALLDLCSHVKNYETQTGRSYLPALQSVFQSPDVWIIDLSERKISVLLEVLKLQTEKKPVDLRRCSEEEREVMSFLQCLPYISQLRFWNISNKEERMSSVRLLLNLCVAAEETDKDTGTRFSTLLSSVCSYKTFPFVNNDHDPSDFLLDLCSHVKNYETQTGRSYLPALQSVFQSPDVWIIDLSERKISVLLEVLKLQTEKKPVDLRRCSEEEREVMSFLQCLPYISQLRFSDQSESVISRFLLSLFIKAAETETQTGEQILKLLASVCTSSSDYGWTHIIYGSDFLLDLCSHVKNYETQTGRSYLPALQSVFQSRDVWIIDLSERKSSVLLEVLKLQTEKKPVELRRCSEEEVMSFLQCLPYISQLRFSDQSKSVVSRFLLSLFIKAAEFETQTGEQILKLLTSVCTSSSDYGWTHIFDDIDFLLDLCSHVKNYETQTGRSYLPALQSVFQSPDVWIIDLSERKISVLLEVLKLQTEKKPVKLRCCSEEEREVMSFLQCLPYISQLRFWYTDDDDEERMSSVRLLLNLCVAAEETDKDTGTRFSTLLSSVCSYKTFPFDEEIGYYADNQSDFLLDLCSHVKNYETQTGRSYLPALQSVFQSPDVWIIDLSERKISVLLEVLKLQTEKKPVELRRCSEEEREVMSFLQCLPYISQLRIWNISNKETRKSSVRLLLNLCVAAEETDKYTGTRFSTLLSSVCSYKTFPFDEEIGYYADDQSDFLLDLCSHVKNYETQTGRSYFPALQSVFQSPDVWIIDLSERKISVLLEVLKLQTEKKPVELRRCSEEEREVMSFLQCLPYISQLRFWNISNKETRKSSVRLLLNLCVAAEETDKDTGTRFSTLLSSVCSYKTFPFDEEFGYYADDQSDFLLDLCSHVKNYETQTGRSYFPALQSVFQSPDVWIIDLSERKSSVLLEVLKLQTEKKPVELRRCSEEEREVKSLLQCLPYISQLRFWDIGSNEETRMSSVRLLLNLCLAAEETDKDTGTRFLTLLSSVCSYKTFFFDDDDDDDDDQSDFLLDLCSHVKNYETQTGRSYLPALQSVFQSPDEWIIDLSERKISVLLEVLKLQTEKKPVKLRIYSEEEREVMSFLQCLPYISQLRFWNISNKEERMSSVRLLLNLCVAAEETDKDTGTRFSTLLSSVCSYKTFPFNYNRHNQSDFLLDLYSHVKNYETQTGRSYLPALQSVFQSPDVWIIDLSERKISVLLEVLKLQTEKKTVDLRRCSEEEREVMSFLQCLPYISQLRIWNISNKETRMSSVRLLLNLCVAAEETDKDTGTRFSTLLSSVCSYKTFPFDYNPHNQSDFLLDLCSHVKNYETQTGRSYLPALQSVFQSPDEWIIDLSERKISVLLEVLKLQTEKKPVELRRCSEEEREVMSFLQCLPYISQLRFWNVSNKETRMSSVRLLLNLCVAAEETDKDTGTRFSTLLSSVCSYKTFPFNKDGHVQIDFLLDLCSHVKNYETQTGRRYLPALQSVFQSPDVWIIDLSERKISVLLEVLKLQTEKKPVDLRRCSEEEREVKSLLQCLPYISQLRLSKETLQKLVECVYEAQEEELTECFLQIVDGDLTSCSLSWEELHYFLQHRIQQITVDFRKSNIQCRISEILPFLNRVQFKRMSSAFMLCVMTEIYESGSAGFVFSLLSSVKNYINLQSRDLDSVHCAALRFTLQHCTAASLNLLWTSIPEEELESILPLFTHLSRLSVDRLLLLKMLHCCSVSDVQQEAAAVLLSVLQHKLDFSCRSALDLTTNTDSEPLHLTADDCRVMSRVIQRAHSDTKTQLILQDCEIHTAGMDQMFPVLHSVQLCCDKPLLLQFLAHVRPEEAQSLSGALGEELDLSQTQLDLQVCRGLELILEYSEGLTELDLSQCRLIDHSLDLLLPNLHKVQNIDFSGNSITDAGAQKIYSIVTLNSNIKTVRLFNNRIESRELFRTDPDLRSGDKLSLESTNS